MELKELINLVNSYVEDRGGASVTALDRLVGWAATEGVREGKVSL